MRAVTGACRRLRGTCGPLAGSMTSPAFVVLTLALVCSIFGTASEQAADPASERAMHTQHNMQILDNVNRIDLSMKTRTNSDSYKVENNLEYDAKKFRSNHKFDNVHFETTDRFNSEQYSKFDKRQSNTNDYIPYREQKGFNGNENFINVHKITSKEPTVVKYIHFGRGYERPSDNLGEAIKTKYDKNFDDNENIKTEHSFEPVSFKDKKIGLHKYLPSHQVYQNKRRKLDKDEVHTKTIASKYVGEDRLKNYYPKDYSKLIGVTYLTPLQRFLKRVKRQETTDICDAFNLNQKFQKMQHPHDTQGKDKNYYSNINCETVLTAGENQVIKLTFIDVFHIEYHPKCDYDFLEIRDGKAGYTKLLGKYCGDVFPPEVTSTGRYMWLKFHSDETIEYEGFTIKVEYYEAASHSIPDSCYRDLSGLSGIIDSTNIGECREKSENHPLDVLWTIRTPANTDIYLNFTTFTLFKPNECEENVVQVFGHVLEEAARLAHYCGSIANSVTTKVSDSKAASEHGNIMYVHLYASQAAAKDTKINATFTAFRTLDPNKDEKCNDDELNCEDNTCIDIKLRCDGYAHCRLKADEDPENCKHETESMLQQTHILVILVIFSLILSGMSFVFLFKCFRKLYQDHKIIKEHIRQSCEDRLDSMISDNRFTLDAKRLQRDSEPRASLERENHANELFKQQRSISQHKQTSLESDFQETHLDVDDEPWRREVDSVPEHLDVKVERNGRTRRSDTSKKEEAMRSRKESVEEKKEIRDAAVGAPDTKESGCQTRESLFQTETALSSDGSNSNSNSRGFSTFGYSGATLVRPSPPAPAISSVHIELMKRMPSQDSAKSQKKIPERRPMSTETTRSAPDVIIVSKPIR